MYNVLYPYMRLHIYNQVSGAKLAWEYCAGQDGADLNVQKETLERCNEQLGRNEQDMAKVSAHLLAADIRYEQLCCRSRPGQEQPGMRLGRRDLVPALRRLLDQVESCTE